MPITGTITFSKFCHRCEWCAKYDDYDVLANTHTPVYYCMVNDFYSKTKPDMKPTLEKGCLCFSKPDEDEDEDETV